MNKMGVVEVSTDGGIQVIKLNRPQRKNALNSEMYNGIIESLNNSAKDNSVVLTVLTGSGNYFSSGNDFSPENIRDAEKFLIEALALFEKFVAAFIDYPKLLIAVVNGPAIGISATILALCDIVYASDKAWFRTPFSQLGLVPEGCSSFTYPRIMGTAKASKLLYLSETMTAHEAMSCGFVTQVFADSQLLKETSDRIQKLAKLPPQSLQMSKQLVRGWDRDLLHKINREESRILLDRFQSEEFFNAILTFNNKKSKL